MLSISRRVKLLAGAAALSLGSCLPIDSALAQVPAGRPVSSEPNWTYGIVRTGEDREAIKSLPMTQRPYRPLHFYGNTVRRMHYRGTAIPAPRDVLGASAATMMRK
ncbi:MAG: hypothetical protein IT423_02195 [Pirellulaceae bacterium]|nr:hypothetical protein [Pirellulaceae bacterium]